MAGLTDTQAKSLSGNKALPDGTVTGLTLKPTSKKGRGNWNLRFVSPVTGKRRDMGLGSYPEVSIHEARVIGQGAQQMIARRLDPIEERRKAETQASAKKVKTFEEAARSRWLEKLDGWKSGKHTQQWIRTLEATAFGKIGHRDVATLEAADFADVLKDIWLKTPETASRVKQRCHEVMNWCIAQRLLTGNPLDVVDHLLTRQPKLSERQKHFPAMEWQKVPEFVQSVLRTGTDVSRLGLEFIIVTAARTGEVRGATWSEIDFENAVWTVPAERMKRKQIHRVPLSPRALEILLHQKEVVGHETLVFPSPRGKILTDMAFTSFLRKHKVMSSEPEKTATSHGFRSSFRDWASHSRVPRDYAEKALAHAIKDKTEAAYHRTDLLEERRKVMNDWADFLYREASRPPIAS